MQLVPTLNDSELERRITEGKTSKKPHWMGIAFLATRNIPCEHFMPELLSVAEQLEGKMAFYQLDVDENPTVTEEQDVEAVPTLQVYRNGERIKKYEGPYSKEALMERLRDLLGTKK